MKLRHSIRPPNPQYIDYIPNQRPAAFPTRDFARASEQNGNAEDGLSQNNQTNGRKSLGSPSLLAANAESHGDNSLSAVLEGIPADQLDNFIASNGDLNPIWVSNMAKMEASGKNFPEDSMDLDVNTGYAAYEAMVLDMEDTDVDGTMSEAPGPSSTGPRDPSWSDLSRRMKAEILDNLLGCYSRRTVCRMLGLTDEERSAIKDLIGYRREQDNLEDNLLKAMRAKQLREFMKIDNSLRNHVQSEPLGFKKASRHTFRRLNKLINPNVDFFACESSELTAARNFLRRREIEAKAAGSWGNEIGLSQPYKNGGGASSKMQKRPPPAHPPPLRPLSLLPLN
ncbi:hypothetical protein ASPVEDRAFT_278312 [Aspergillus versicolor CBS 583.65]|uniref:Uncharacterized protein n=1 Tax=Aspergillus versicolor CBS 583.65 TaxID=1036611 RepID=A0A1L9P6Q1_ASPVE|nr:uncharacterized protein ASPVEDRAFT_278312 [Aspergillus versicolor CBS 583.65]OJI97207.1 hypothetical protein ASPVEDRAFT_278312 [Aspergillus versicolor CBS 583.65]